MSKVNSLVTGQKTSFSSYQNFRARKYLIVMMEVTVMLYRKKRWGRGGRSTPLLSDTRVSSKDERSWLRMSVYCVYWAKNTPFASFSGEVLLDWSAQFKIVVLHDHPKAWFSVSLAVFPLRTDNTWWDPLHRHWKVGGVAVLRRDSLWGPTQRAGPRHWDASAENADMPAGVPIPSRSQDLSSFFGW